MVLNVVDLIPSSVVIHHVSVTNTTVILSENKKPKNDDSAGQERPKAKEARKERKVLEKKMALSRKRKLDSRLVTRLLLHNLKDLRLQTAEKMCMCSLKGVCKFLTFRKEGELSSKKKGDAELSKKMVCMICKSKHR